MHSFIHSSCRALRDPRDAPPERAREFRLYASISEVTTLYRAGLPPGVEDGVEITLAGDSPKGRNTRSPRAEIGVAVVDCTGIPDNFGDLPSTVRGLLLKYAMDTATTATSKQAALPAFSLFHHLGTRTR